ncbi:MAG: hypothetical protein IPO10_17335 [Flavobacteriales bacterium]|nr:hypothetical protein [Flavobacteriales bacterium]
MAQEEETELPVFRKHLQSGRVLHSKTGKIIETQFHKFGNNERGEYRTMLTNLHRTLAEHVELRAIKMGMQTGGQFSRYRSATIDKDEVEDLLTALRLMKDKIYTTTRNTYTEVNYYSRCGFKVSCYFVPNKLKWNGIVQLDKYHSDSVLELSEENLSKLIELIEGADL